MLLVERHQIVPRQPGERLGGAAGWPAVGVVAEDQTRGGGGGDVGGVLLIDLEAVHGLPAPALELVLRKGRMEDDVREQVEPEVELVRGDPQVDVARLGAGVGVEVAAHEVDGLGDLLRRAGGRALGEQPGRGVGEPGLALRLVGLAGVEQHAQRDERLLMLLDDHQLQAVGQRLLLEGGEADLLGRSRRRRRGRRGRLGHRLGSGRRGGLFRFRGRRLRQARVAKREEQARGAEGFQGDSGSHGFFTSLWPAPGFPSGFPSVFGRIASGSM